MTRSNTEDEALVLADPPSKMAITMPEDTGDNGVPLLTKLPNGTVAVRAHGYNEVQGDCKDEQMRRTMTVTKRSPPISLPSKQSSRPTSLDEANRLLRDRYENTN